MSRRSQRCRWFPLLAAGTAVASSLLAGCVDRRFIIDSDPPGAEVYVNNKRIGVTPVDRQFVYYGRYRFTLVRDGYDTLVVDQPVKTPWYEWFPLEFISENVIPWTIRDVRHYKYTMQPTQLVPPEVLFNRGEQLRHDGQQKGLPASPQVVQGAPQAVPVVPAVPPPGAIPVQPGVVPPAGAVPIQPGAVPPAAVPPGLPPGAGPDPLLGPGPGPAGLPPR